VSVAVDPGMEDLLSVDRLTTLPSNSAMFISMFNLAR
jgi:hypothetical protein